MRGRAVKYKLNVHKGRVEWGSTNTSWHIGVRYVKNFMHTQSVKLINT